ncbi:hypothetical protein F5X97DRAFT_304156 [Nemania serpens]|nr:hypothetical protein F5X97DRAFT_304156 [Nemania serpens]
MADANYFLDLSSSPDPLADDVPSSARPATRRTTKTQQDLSSFTIPQSSPRRGLRAQSPRKRTFQLDVGNERSPQRIRVTVEAEEGSGRDSVNRRLFPPPASPTKSARNSRSPRRREAITTTTVPLNDGDDQVGTPRRRGRPRRTSNGTPMPRGRKRTGTPIQRKSKQARHEDEPSSDTGILMDASTDVAVDGGDEIPPNPKPRARGTPRRQPANASVPSSQASGKTTGRKRGRPRKVPIPEEPAVSTGTGPQASEVIMSNNTSTTELNTQQHGREGSPSTKRDKTPDGDHINDYASPPASSPPSKKSNSTTSPSHLPSSPNTARIDRSSGSPGFPHQELPESDHYVMDDDYQGMEPQSDLQSIESEEGMTLNRRDTIADASDFSMIAVESLPSFQASFQASLYREADQPASDYPEMGEETSRIISETLGSLRRSLQTEMGGPSHATEDDSNLDADENRDQDRDQDRGEDRDQDQDQDETLNQSTMTTSYSSERAFAKSPRRLKQLPLSRKVFVGRGNIDDTFSSIPDSILNAATPGRPTINSATGEYEAHDREDGAFEDSFSEIPEAVLEAATPRPARRIEMSARGSPARNVEPIPPTGQRSSPDYGPRRLPTPDDTSSSNVGSKQTHGEDIVEADPLEQPVPLHRTDVPSSPPIRARPRALDFGYSNLQRELVSVKERGSSSPQRPPVGNTVTHQLQSLEAPLPPARPSLSPIVRAGRTLQNVMSDNSSPEGRELNLGSPFRGSRSSEYPHQSSVPRSPSPSIRKRGVPNKSQLPTSSPNQVNQSFGSNLNRNPIGATLSSRQIEDTFGQNSTIRSRRDSLPDSTTHQPSGLVLVAHNPSMASSIRVSPPSADEKPIWAPHIENSQRVIPQQPSSQPPSFSSQRTAETHSIDGNQAATAVERDSYPSHDKDHHDDSTHTMEEDIGDSFHEHADGGNDGDDDSDHANDGDDDDFDIWDIEASRTSPGKGQPAGTASRESKSNVPPSQRSKVPSPWRRNNRRLIYKDDIASSSQIEVEESPQSETEQYPPTLSGEQPLAAQRQQDAQIRAPDPEPVQKSRSPEEPNDQDRSSPTHSHNSYEEQAGLADSDELDVWMEDEEPGIPDQPQAAVGPIRENPENVIQEEREDVDMPTAPGPSMDMSEYSMVNLQAKQVPKRQEKPVQSKPGFFGGFDILSFFSSPATLPRNRSSGSDLPGPVNNPTAVQPTQPTGQPKEPPMALWSTGLFPSIPKNNSEPSSGRRADLFSASSGLRSSDTVADTYEPSTTASPPLSLTHSRSESAAPSTPERQVYPPIQQKKNFTPQPGQSRGSLFAPIEANSSESTGELSDGLEETSDEQDSAMTESSDYERVPPREKPSQWDRNLSPTKSCFRSPLKPTTPGRIVAFSNSALPPIAQAAPAQTQVQTQTRNALHSSTGARNTTILQGPPRRLTFEGKENQPHPHTQEISNANDNALDKTIAPKPSTTSRAGEQSRDVAPTEAAASAAVIPLSQTTWSKQHWQRLDEMLQLRRRDPSSFGRVCSLPPPERRAGSAALLLGREVVAHAARLIIEPWHLDVVDAFKLEVGGWDESALAKRVFALIVGEEKRRAAAAATAATATTGR